MVDPVRAGVGRAASQEASLRGDGLGGRAAGGGHRPSVPDVQKARSNAAFCAGQEGKDGRIFVSEE